MTFILGTQPGIESLKSDVLAIHNATKGVLAKAGDFQVPSWRFPEKLSTCVDLEALLKDLRYTNSHDKDCAAHVLLLELTVDRLLLLLQACLQLSDHNRTSAPPLTLQSSVKKFAKKFIQDATAFSSSKSQASAEVVSNQQDSSRPLPDANCLDASTRQAVALQPRPQQATVACQTLDTAFATCAKCFDLQHCLASASSLVAHLCRASGGSDSPALAATDWKTLAAVGGLSPSKWEAALGKDLACVEEYCTFAEQTCVKLSTDLNTRDERILHMEAEVCALTTQVGALRAQVEEMRVEGDTALAGSKADFEAQLRQVEEVRGREGERAAVLAAELDGARFREEQLRAHMSQLEHKVMGLESELQRQRGREEEVSVMRNGFEEQLERVRAEVDDWQRKFGEESLERRKAVAHTQSLERTNKAIQAKQSALLARLDEVDKECEHLRSEVAHYSTAAKGKDVELEKMESKCSNLQSKCTELQVAIADHESKYAHSVSEQQQLSCVVSTLEEQVRELKSQLEAEKERCRLLMEYPYIKPSTSKGKMGDMSPLESQRQVSANTIRILLLEEQNADLRQQQVVMVMKEADPSSSHHQSTVTPTKLWKTDLLSRAARERASHTSSAKSHREVQSACTHPTNQPVGRDAPGVAAQERCSKSQSSTRLKGRLGRLVTAIAEAHGGQVPPPAIPLGWMDGKAKEGQGRGDVETYTCQRCDRMFSSLSELERHVLVCSEPVID